ncbi:MAG: hypothetical protein ACE5HD_00505 [Acidobacteriota bacterium]
MTLVNDADEAVRSVQRIWGDRVPAFAELWRLARESPAPFRIIPGESGFEMACENQVRGRANRSRVKIVAYPEGKMGVFFFKTSSVPGGSRYSYGGLAVARDRLHAARLGSWLEFLASGLAADKLPRGVQSSHQFTIPG